MTEKEKQIKILTAQVCAYTAACAVDDFLQESGYVAKELKNKPNKLTSELLSAKVKLENSLLKLMPDFTAKQTDFTNELSCIIEDVIKDMYERVQTNRFYSTRDKH